MQNPTTPEKERAVNTDSTGEEKPVYNQDNTQIARSATPSDVPVSLSALDLFGWLHDYDPDALMVVSTDTRLWESRAGLKPKAFKNAAFRSAAAAVDAAEMQAGTREVWFTPARYRELGPDEQHLDTERQADRALPGRVAWCDADHEDEWTDAQRADRLAWVDKLRAAVVMSGTGNNRHLYVKLREPQPMDKIERLNRQLVALFGGDPSKVDGSSLLRFPGTFNHKTDPGNPVVLERVPTDFDGWDYDELSKMLPPPVDPPKKLKGTGKTGAAESGAANMLALPPDHPSRGNNWLAQVAGVLASAFHSQEVYEAVGRNLNWACVDPQDEADVMKTLASIWRSEQSKNLMDPPSNPVKVARRLIAELWTTEEGRATLRRWRGSWMRWSGTHWHEIESQQVWADVQNRLEDAKYQDGVDDNGQARMVDWAPNTAKVNDVANAVKNIALLNTGTEPNRWLDERGEEQLIAFQNGLLDLRTRRLLPVNPMYFNLGYLPHDYAETDDEPVEWLRFLDEVLPGDPASIALLQEWFGYVISGRTDLQKLLMMVGLPRSGKGTVNRVLMALLGGELNVAGLTMANFAANFGLSRIIGKTLAVVGDARTPERDKQTIIERILAITGEDPLSIDRKNREAFDGVVKTRLMMMSNETLRLPDPSGALPNRFLCVEFAQSFLGREDPALLGKLTQEIPAILRWALDGLDRLNEQGRFTEPAAAAAARTEMMSNASKVKAFAEERLVFSADKRIVAQEAFDAFCAWCKLGNYKAPSIETFGSQLTAAYRGKFKKTRPTINGERTSCYEGFALKPRGRD